MQVICWVLGEYGLVAREGPASVMEQLAAIPDSQSVGDDVRACLLSAVGKLGAQLGQGRLPAAAEEQLHLSAASHNIDLQQRALEALAILKCVPGWHAGRSAMFAAPAALVCALCMLHLPLTWQPYASVPASMGLYACLPCSQDHLMPHSC